MTHWRTSVACAAAFIAAAAFAQDPYATSSGAWGQTYRDKWGVERIGWAPEIASASRRSIVVAVIDTGLDYYHPSLPRDRIAWNRRELPNGRDDDANGYVDDVQGWNFVDNNGNPWDHAGHGTMVAGIIADIDPNARILPLKVLNFIGRGRATRVAEAIYYAVGAGARVVNLSIGGTEPSQAVKRAIDYADGKGVVVVVAAGNDGKEVGPYSPAALPNVIAVGATDVNDQRASFSSYGAAVDLVAPGTDILSLRARRTDVALVAGLENYVKGRNFVGPQASHYRANGTSFAAPFVAGAASLILSQRPDLDARAVRRMIVQSARDVALPGVDADTGYGLLDVKAALVADPSFFVDARIAGIAVERKDGGVFVRVMGTADADRLASARIELGQGESPATWRSVSRRIDRAVRDGVLDDLPAQSFAGATVWTLRLVVEHANGKRRESRHVVRLG